MSCIGPQVPPHLKKRKRTPDDDGDVASPPSKRAPKNQDEIALEEDDDSSEDDYGPSVPKQQTATSQTFTGPTLPPPDNAPKRPERPSIGPPHPPRNTEEIPLDDSDSESDSQSGPAPAGPLPPPPPPPRRILGPSLPPGPLAERPPDDDERQEKEDEEDGSDDDDDDDYGPSLPTSTTHQARHSRARAAAEAEAADRAHAAPRRDDWMLAPPKASDGAGARAADPTRIRARKFNSGPRAGGGGAAGGGGGGGDGEISSVWTETPEQKRRRLEDAVLGRGGSSSTAATAAGNNPDRAGGGSARTREEEERDAAIRANLEAARGPSLYAEHQRREGGQGGRIEEEEDDPSKRGFDREKDMKLGGRIGTAQRRDLLNQAKNFGGRFSSGKYL